MAEFEAEPRPFSPRRLHASAGRAVPTIRSVRGEPGTFKDRHCLNTDPHRFLEGMLVGAHVIEASDVCLSLRDECPISHAILRHEIARLPPGGRELHRIGLEPGDRMRLDTRRGAVEVKVRSDRDVPVGMIFLPFCSAEAAANLLTDPALDPVGLIPEFRFRAARASPLPAAVAAE